MQSELVLPIVVVDQKQNILPLFHSKCGKIYVVISYVTLHDVKILCETESEVQGMHEIMVEEICVIINLSFQNTRNDYIIIIYEAGVFCLLLFYICLKMIIILQNLVFLQLFLVITILFVKYRMILGSFYVFI